MPLLYLLRHGLADGQAGDAEDPPLTPEGERLMAAEARGMAALGLIFDAVLASPLMRARQTAHIVAGTMGLDGKVQVTAALSPGAKLESLTRLSPSERALLVGHAPDMGRIAAELIGARSALPVGKGTLLCLEVAAWPPEPPALLHFVLPPEALAGLGAYQR